MLRLVLAFGFLLVSLSQLSAQTPDYLTGKAEFSAAWATLLEEIGAAPDVAEILVEPERITLLARTQGGGKGVEAWSVERRRVLFRLTDVADGPDPAERLQLVADAASAFFPLNAVPLDRLDGAVRDALERIDLEAPGRVTSVRIARAVSLIPEPSFGEVRWDITLGTETETATVYADAAGQILGADISGTARGRNQDFLTQADWPFADAQLSFRSIVGSRAEVYEIDVSKTAITMQAVTPGNPKYETRWFWGGGSFRKDFIDTPNPDAISGGGDLPFSLDEIDLAQLPAVLAAARAEHPTGHPDIKIVRAVKERQAGLTPAVHWTVGMADTEKPERLFGGYDERTVVKLTTDAKVVSVLLPLSMRPVVDPMAGEAVLAALAGFRGAYGDDKDVFELSFHTNRSEVRFPHPDQAGMTKTVLQNENGLMDWSDFPITWEEDEDLYPLRLTAELDAALIERIKADAIADIAMDGGEVFMLRIWSGQPFFKSINENPLIEVRVGIPPRFDIAAYSVFTIDGILGQTVK